ncbi:MAG: hypothetical protein NZO58_09685, partial [Gemmataceae bacterium]|nr:hypothetical protein [Gemmataceae bacterium]
PPPRVVLCFRAVDPVVLARMMMSSRRALVRAWGLQRIEALLDQRAWPELEAIAREALHDVDEDLRRQAAILAWKRTTPQTDEALLSLIREMAGNNVDDALHMVEKLRGALIPADALARIRDRLEGERPTTCPLCGIPLSRRERPEHLRNQHGYVELDGEMWPRRQAENRLWDRVFSAGDADAHQQLLRLFGDDPAGRSAYVAALEAQLSAREDLDEAESLAGAAFNPQWEPWLNCLRMTLATHPVLPRLLHSETPRAWAVGQALVLSELTRRLRGAGGNSTAVQRAVEETLPGREFAAERVRVCGMLPKLGIDPAVASDCQAKFRDELPVRCPECPAQVRAADLELHLRRAHKVFQFRGVRRSYSETRDYLLNCLCGGRPDVQAWLSLCGLAEDRYGEAATERLALWICTTIKAAGKERRDPMVASAAEAIARTSAGPRLAMVLLGDAVQSGWKNVARQLALEIVARTESAWTDDDLKRIEPYLASKELPRETRRRAVAGLLRLPGLGESTVSRILQAYVSAMSKTRAVERLRELEELVGQVPAIEKLCADLEDRIRMTCPRCQVQLERAEMVRHLWDRHRLLLDGRQVREPWRVLADWVVDYVLEKDPALLERCWELARKADPHDGPRRLQRMLLRQGVDDRDAWEALLSQARAVGDSLCPHCLGQTPRPYREGSSPLVEDNGLSGHGFRLEINDTGLTPRLRITGPDGVLWDGNEPGGGLTPLGAFLILAIPVALSIFGILWALPFDVPWPVQMLFALGLSLFPDALIYWFWPQGPVRRRLLDAAWHIVIPELLSRPLTDAATGFLEALVATDEPGFLPDADVVEAAWAAVQRDRPQSPALAGLLRRRLAHRADELGDLVAAASEVIVQALAGKIPLRAAHQALARALEEASPEIVRRLRVLTCAHAAALGLSSNDLTDLLHTKYTFGPVLAGADLDYLRQVRHLASLAGRLPTDLPKADSVLDLAADAHRAELLARYPDVLLLDRAAGIRVGTRGVWLKDLCVTEQPSRVDVVAARGPDGPGFEIVVGHQRAWFSSDPRLVATHLERWLRFYFVEFLPQAARPTRQRSSEASRRLWRANCVVCSECHRRFVPIAGEVGLRLTEGETVLTS